MTESAKAFAATKGGGSKAVVRGGRGSGRTDTAKSRKAQGPVRRGATRRRVGTPGRVFEARSPAAEVASVGESAPLIGRRCWNGRRCTHQDIDSCSGGFYCRKCGRFFADEPASAPNR